MKQCIRRPFARLTIKQRICGLQPVGFQSINDATKQATVEIACNFNAKSKQISLASFKGFYIKDFDYFYQISHIVSNL